MWGARKPPLHANTKWALSTEEPVPELSPTPPLLVETPSTSPQPEAATPRPLPGIPVPYPLLPSPGRPVPCGPHEATCHSGHCIPKDYVCDGQEDCKDGSDELDCGEDRAEWRWGRRVCGSWLGEGLWLKPCPVHPGPAPPCEPNEFPCGNGHCVLKLWRCDGDSDCEDHTDEADCRECPCPTQA